MPSLLIMVAIFLCLMAGIARADDDRCHGATADCIRTGEWEFEIAAGLGSRDNPLVSGDDIPLVVIPQWRYYGDRWFIDNLELGYTFVEDAHFLFSGIVTPGLDHLYFHRWDPANLIVDVSDGQIIDVFEGQGGVNSPSLGGLHDRRYALLGGVEFAFRGNWGELQSQLLWDVGGTHEGQEWRVAYGLPFAGQRWHFNSSVGLTWKSDELVTYYYGIRPEEVAESRATYEGGATFNPFVKFTASHELRNDWHWLASFQWEKLGEGIHASPIVEEDEVMTIFMGVGYRY